MGPNKIEKSYQLCENLNMKFDIENKIKNLCNTIAEIKPLQNFLDAFAKHKFAGENNEIISPKIYLVGGAVRDVLLDKKFKDYDFVVEGISKETLKKFLESVPGKLMDIEGRNFGVFKLKLEDCNLEFIDIALPRIDIYQEHGLGHKDVQVKTNQNLTIQDDLGRRDFTINAMAIDLSARKLIDPFNGLQDLEEKTLKSVGVPYDRLVKEDPTRIMRALRFAAKYDLDIEKNTFDTISKYHHEINKKFSQEYTNKKGVTKKREIERVSRDIIASEFVKGFYHQPAKMIELLDESGVYQEIFPPEIIRVWESMKTCDQPENYHSEGSVWNHTMLALKNIDKIYSNDLGIPQEVDINTKMAVWLHDFGKVDTFRIDEEGNYTYYNHPQVSAELAEHLFTKMNINSLLGESNVYKVNEDQVIFAIENHMLPFGPDVTGMKNNTIVKYYLKIIEPKTVEFGKSRPTIEMSPEGISVLQLAYVDANSSIKKHGPQDFTGLKNMIGKINQVKQHLEKYDIRTVYPITGHDLMKVFGNISQDEKYKDFARFQKTGGIFFGDMMDYVLEDALENPSAYQEKIDYSHLQNVVLRYIEVNGIKP